jgi:hypothetical protein
MVFFIAVLAANKNGLQFVNCKYKIITMTLGIIAV